MKPGDSWLIRYVTPSAVLTAWLLRTYLDSSIAGLSYSLVGLAALGLLIAIYIHGRSMHEIVYNQELQLVAVVRRLSIDMFSLVKIQSVPIGIDLSDNAKGVLRAMWTRYQEEHGGELRFVMCRPLSDEQTKLGFLVVRSISRMGGARSFQALTEKVSEDLSVLKAAMNASYPHVPVVQGDAREVLLALSGGIGSLENE